uniref:Uncharacterized protein n=1 Tax=Glossina palpalis gambiensis TaxID=67801 RepID=A0A1B0BXR2_9MUSC
MFDMKWLPIACGSLAPALIPPVHIVVLWYFWENYARYVDRHFCTCSCWDTVFKGPYESGVAAYKHMYFNATQNTFKMWLLTITELIATTMVMQLADSTNTVTSKKIFCIVGIALLHIIASSFDQFFLNVVRGEGYAHQIIRDIGFMVPDIMQLIIPLWLLKQTRKESFITRPFYRDRNLHKDIITTIFFVLALFMLCSIL